MARSAPPPLDGVQETGADAASGVRAGPPAPGPGTSVTADPDTAAGSTAAGTPPIATPPIGTPPTGSPSTRPSAHPRRGRHDRVWAVSMGVGAAAVLTYELVDSWLVRDVLYLLAGLGAAVAIVVGVRLHRPRRPRAWYVMAAGQLVWVVGDTLTNYERDVLQQENFPTAADACYLAGYLLLGLSVGLLLYGRGHFRDLGGQLDSALVTVGFGLLTWVVVLQPTLREAASGGVLSAATGAAYPIADILLASLAARLVTVAGGMMRSLRLLFTALLLLIAADTLALTLGLLRTNTSTVADLLWLASYVCWAGAALHPSMRRLSDDRENAQTGLTRGRLVALTVAVLVAPGVLAVQHLLGRPINVWAVTVGAVVMFLLVVARMQVALREIMIADRLRAQAQEELARQAAHDSLTGIPNRAQALRLIKGALSRGQRSGAIVGLLFVDLDGFKRINDTFGHAAGDVVLKAVATRMQREIRQGDVVARLGGDEFVVLLEPLDAQPSAVLVAERLVAAVSAPIPLHHGDVVRVGASIGVALSQDGVTDPAVLMHEADVAVYRAKAAGRGRIEVFDESLRRELALKADLESGLSGALARDELTLHYQPIVDLSDGRVAGYEALVRWNRPGVGLISPAEFLPIAEQSELICEIDAWVLERACRQLAQWSAEGAEGADTVYVAVNLAGRHLARARVVGDVTRALDLARVDAARLVLEVPETTLIDDPLAHVNVASLRRLGVRVSMDDFGTGYSSIARLETLPVDAVKIDRRYLQSNSPSADKLLRLIIQAAHAYGLPVIAEGVERPEQLAVLREVSTEAAQGYLLGRPAEQPEPAHTSWVVGSRQGPDAGIIASSRSAETGGDQR